MSPKEFADGMANQIKNDIEELIKNNPAELNNASEEFLISHKQLVIDNIKYIRTSKLPEILRGDIEVMAADILHGGVYEMQDLAYVYSCATKELKDNPKFQLLVKKMEEMFKAENKKLDEDREKATLKRLKRYHEIIEDRKKELRKEFDVADKIKIEAVDNNPSEKLQKIIKLIENKERLSEEQINDPDVKELLTNGIWTNFVDGRINRKIIKRELGTEKPSIEAINRELKTYHGKILPKSLEYKKKEEQVNILESAIESEDEEYLLLHKSEIIDNIDNIQVSKLPEKLRSDIEVMAADILNSNVYEMQDLACVYSYASKELKGNPKFQLLVEKMEEMFKAENKKLDEDREKTNSEILREYHKRVEKTKLEIESEIFPEGLNMKVEKNKKDNSGLTPETIEEATIGEVTGPNFSKAITDMTNAGKGEQEVNKDENGVTQADE